MVVNFIEFFNYTEANVVKIGENKLKKIVNSLFNPPNSSEKIEILYNSKKNSNLTSVRKKLELDIWIPSLNIGFEYQVYFLFYLYHFTKSQSH